MKKPSDLSVFLLKTLYQRQQEEAIDVIALLKTHQTDLPNSAILDACDELEKRRLVNYIGTRQQAQVVLNQDGIRFVENAL